MPIVSALQLFLAEYKAGDGNERRKLLRKFVAQLQVDNRLLKAAWTKDIEAAHGKSFRNFIDSTDSHCLWNLVRLVFDKANSMNIDGTNGTAMSAEVVRSIEHPALHARPKTRGSGFSYGSPMGWPTGDAIFWRLESMYLNINTNRGTDQMSFTEYDLTRQAFGLIYILQRTGKGDAPVTGDLKPSDVSHIFPDGDFDDTHRMGIISTAMLLQENRKDSPVVRPEELTEELHRLCELAVDDIVSPGYGEEPEPSEPEVATAVTVPESSAQILNATLNVATSGAVTDINALLKEMAETKIEVNKLRNQPVTVSQAPKATSGTVGDLTYKINMVEAATVFGKRAKALKFDIAQLEWTDSSGNVVTHPNTPDVDPNYEFRTEHLIKFLTAHNFNQNIWLHGDTGTGKTTLAEQIGARLGYPVFRMNLDSAIERGDIIGSVQLRERDGVMVSKFIEGMLPQAMALPAFFILDEMDAGHADVLFAVQRALENKGLVLTEDGGRVVLPNDHFRFIATANTRGQGDEKGWYAGVRPMNVATLDRFGTFIEVGYIDPKTERKLLSNKFPSLTDTDLAEFTELSKKIRDAFKNGELSTTLSPRGMMAFCQTYLHFLSVLNTRKEAIDHALEMVIVDRAPLDSQTKVKEFAQLCIN